MPIDISAIRPAAFKRGPQAKPKSLLITCSGLRFAISSKAIMPALPLPARIQRKPCSTKIRLLASKVTTSATVPKATKSNSEVRLCSGKAVC